MKNVKKERTILFVEDHPMAQFLGKAILENFPLIIDMALTGQEAVDKANSKKYDFIFMDIGLPDFSGIEVTKKIRKGKSLNKKAPIVALTAHRTDEYREQAKSAGMDDYMVKPLTPENAEKILKKFKIISS